jgi:hypothetical protein
LLNEEAKYSDLIIYSDAASDPKLTLEVENLRAYLRSIKGFKSITIHERLSNLGLFNSIIHGVTEVLSAHSTAIVLEDDIVVSPYFLEYMNLALEKYQLHPEVASIHGYVYPVNAQLPDSFFISGADCWGWGTWKRAWNFFEKDSIKLYLKFKNNKKLIKEFNYGNSYNFFKMLKDQSKGKVNSWAIRWYASTFLRNMYTLYPKKSYVKNLGFDYKGTHPNNFFFNHSKLQNQFKKVARVPLAENVFYKEKLKFFFIRQKFLRFIYLIKYLVIKKVF